MKSVHILVVLLLNYGCMTNAANILAMLNIPSPSLHIWNSPLLIALAERGHNVTVLSTKAQSKPVANLTDIVFEGIYEFLNNVEDYNPEEMTDLSPYTGVSMFLGWIGQLCEYSIQTEATKKLYNYPDDFKFDLIIFEPTSGECLLGLAKKFGSPPIIAVASFSHVQWVNYMVQNPDHPAYMPHLFMSYTDHMTFRQRFNNLLLHLYTEFLYKVNLLPTLDDIASQNLGSSASIPSEELRRVSMLMVNTHPAFDYPRPLLPSVINVAGIHIKEPKALPKDLKVFLDEAKEGVVFFSLGSNVQSSQLKKEKIQAILEAFSELPEKVLWKWEADSLPGQPKNVKIGKWLPQNDILAHPNVRLFITHSGLLSTQEAIYRAVPVVGIPFFADQQINIHKSVNHGIGVHLPYKNISKHSLLKAIRTVLDDPRSPPIIAVTSFSHARWVNYMVENPDHPAYTPDIFLSYTDHMTFNQRFQNLLLYLYTEYAYRSYYLPAIDDVSSRHLGPSASIPSEEIRKVSVLMVNTHPAFDYPRPLLPSVINVAGIHIKEPKALPKDLKVFLDEAKEGVIFFSLGSNVRSSQLKKEKIQAILEAFSELPEKVLWKWEADTLPGQPKNVKIGKWLPQNDILAHPNVRLFITHSGLLSTQETIYREVPVVGIPFMADQQINIHKSVNHGIGVHLPYKDINKNTLLKAIRTVLDDPSYAKNIRELSAKMRDEQETPLQRAVYWCEYVMRHNGARHLRSAAMDLNRFQYLLLDVISVLIIGIITIFVFIVYLFKFLFCRKRTQKKIKKN